MSHNEEEQELPDGSAAPMPAPPPPDQRPDRLDVPAEAAGERLDAFVAAHLPWKSRCWFRHRIKDGDIRINGKFVRPSETLRAGDEVTFNWPADKSFVLQPENIDLDILAEEPEFLVLNKPSDMVVHPAKGNWTGTLVQGLLANATEEFKEMIDDEMRPGIVHRLDKDTSGALVIAKTVDALAALRHAFKEHLVSKTYLTVIIGALPQLRGEIRTNIGRHGTDRKKMSVLDHAGKPAETHYEVIATTVHASLLRVRILTGRTHQIRVHMAHLRHPVLGDAIYGGRRQEMPFMPDRQMLHAWKLTFPHPRTGERVEFTAPPPPDFLDCLARYGLTLPAA